MPNANKGIVVPSFNLIGVFAIVDLNEAYRATTRGVQVGRALWAAVGGGVTFERDGTAVSPYVGVALELG